MRFPSNWVNITNHMCVCVCVNMCGLVIATPIGHHYACQTLIYGPIRLKFGIWNPINWVSMINQCGCGHVHGFVLVTPTGSCLGCQKLIERTTWSKFEWLPQCFMLTLARKHWVYVASIDLSIYLSTYLSIYIY